MCDTVMVITCYVHRSKGFKYMYISLTKNSLSGTLHMFCMFAFLSQEFFQSCGSGPKYITTAVNWVNNFF